MARRRRDPGKRVIGDRSRRLMPPTKQPAGDNTPKASAPKRWRIALALAVLLSSAIAFGWVEFYKGTQVTPVLRSFSILSDCDNEQGFVGLIINSGPVMEMDIGLEGPVKCSHIQFTIPMIVGDIISVIPHGRQHIPENAMTVKRDSLNGAIVDIFPQKMPTPSGYISFPTLLSRDAFDTYSLLLPVHLTTDNQALLYSVKKMTFSAMVKGVFDVSSVHPSSASIKEQLRGEHLVMVSIDEDEEISVTLQSQQLKGVKNLVQWIAAAFFAASAAYLLGLVGLRF